MIAGLLGAWIAPVVASGAGATTSTTLPGPAPNQSQINSTESQVSQIESTLAQEEQQTSILDEKYDTAEQNAQDAQNALASLNATMVRTKSAVDVDKRLVANDAVEAYIYGTPESGYAVVLRLVGQRPAGAHPVHESDRRRPTEGEGGLQRSESKLQTEEVQQQQVAAQAQAEAAQTKTLAAANEQEATTTQATLNQIQGQLAQEVAQAAIEEAQEEAAAAAAAASAAARQQAAAAAATAATVAGAVGGSTDGAAATDAANQAAGPAAYQGPIAGTSQGDSEQMAAVQAAVSQLGTPYVFGGEEAGRRVRLLGTGAVGLGAGRRHHPADDRDAVAGAPARVTRRARAR